MKTTVTEIIVSHLWGAVHLTYLPDKKWQRSPFQAAAGAFAMAIANLTDMVNIC
jgi:hypothetical protein